MRSYVEVRELIDEEKNLYVTSDIKRMKFFHQKRYMIWRELRAFRLMQFYRENLNHNILYKIKYRFYLRQKNIYSEKTGIEIANHSCLGRRINIWHGGVILSADIGDDCTIHGNNVLGNKGYNPDEYPHIGNGVDIGVGAVVIGKVNVADNCTIGANSCVNKNFDIPGRIILGTPARYLSNS